MTLRRRPAIRNELSRAEESFLRFGRALERNLDGSLPFERASRRGEIDDRAVLRAWRDNRDRLLAKWAETGLIGAETGLISWAQRVFEGASGAVDPWEHLHPDHETFGRHVPAVTR